MSFQAVACTRPKSFTPQAGHGDKDVTSAEGPSGLAGEGAGQGAADDAAASTRPANPALPDDAEIVAASFLQVNNRFFSIDEIVRAARPRLVQLPQGLAAPLLRQRVEEILAETMRDTISATLVLEQAERAMPEDLRKQIEAQVETKLKDMMAQAGSGKKLERKLEAQGSTIDEYRKSFGDKVRIQAFLQNKFAPAIVVSRRMLWEYYCDQREEFVSPKQVQMQIIAAPTDAFAPGDAGAAPSAQAESPRDQARKTITEAADAVRRGEDFGEAARTHSKGIKASGGGIWPMMPAGSFRHTEVEKAAFAMAEGQVSDVIETEAGFFIVKALQVVPETVTTFEQAQDEIDYRLRAEQYSRLANAYFEELYSNATIIHRQELKALAVDRAIAWHLSRWP